MKTKRWQSTDCLLYWHLYSAILTVLYPCPGAPGIKLGCQSGGYNSPYTMGPKQAFVLSIVRIILVGLPSEIPQPWHSVLQEDS